ncbi:MAG: hypothetical protein V4858_23220 [Pseudomonadota bacterium]
MLVRIFDCETQPETLTDLRGVLSARNGSVASFWLVDSEGPCLAVMVKNEVACVHYFPNREHPGFYSVGPTEDWENHVSFVADNHESTPVPVAMVIPWAKAETAAEEFFQAKGKPVSLEWREL